MQTRHHHEALAEDPLSTHSESKNIAIQRYISQGFVTPIFNYLQSLKTFRKKKLKINNTYKTTLNRYKQDYKNVLPTGQTVRMYILEVHTTSWYIIQSNLSSYPNSCKNMKEYHRILKTVFHIWLR